MDGENIGWTMDCVSRTRSRSNYTLRLFDDDDAADDAEDAAAAFVVSLDGFKAALYCCMTSFCKHVEVTLHPILFSNGHTSVLQFWVYKI